MKGIRFIILFIIILFCGMNADAQGVRIYKTDGTVITIPSSQLDSIVNVLGKEFVDLGLSVKWAACNIGAERPEQYGYYFAWGETLPKEQYSKNENASGDKVMWDISGDVEYDAARVSWGSPARIPTNTEINELCEKCRWQRVLFNNIFGMLVTGPNGNSIFLPAAGFLIESSAFGAGCDGYYWSSTPIEYSEEDAYYLDFDKQFYYSGNWMRRYIGQTIRPVSDYEEE